MIARQPKPLRLALKLAFAAALLVLLILAPVADVDFVYTGF
jgi:hypothetical protein